MRSFCARSGIPYNSRMSWLIRGGWVIDGTGARARRADVRIQGERIAQVGPGLKPEPGESVLDAGGRVVAPGFIDAHSHADGGVLESLDAETQVRQGITTAIVGQDGGHNYPLGEWLGKIDTARPALNYASFIGHGTVRGQVLGKDYQRQATASEVRAMRLLVAREMKAGALGLSSGLEYEPGLFSDTPEIVALAEVAGIYGGVYISHVRDEEDDALKSFDELITIAEKARIPAQISHIKLGSAPVWGKTKSVFQKLDEARKRGLDVSADVYPYTFWQSGLVTILESREWGDVKLWEKAIAGIGGASQIRITGYAPEPSYQNKTLDALARELKKSPAQLASELVLKANGAVGVVVTAMQEKDLEAFLRHPKIMFCTDGGLRGTHPRGAGSYPRILGRYVRERRVLSLEEAIRKATSLPAVRFGLKERGILKPGNVADLVVFDPLKINDTATVESPRSAPVGLGDVFVGGVSTLSGGKLTGQRGGRALRRNPHD
jgi:N-acyl-D-amino-acid deacylase